MKALALLIMTLMLAVAPAAPEQQKPTAGYAPVNGINMYYEVHGSGEPVVLLHGAFMTITNNWDGWIGELSKTRKVIAVEMQGHGRTADVPGRDISSENLADDVAALLDTLKIARADLIGYSMGGAVAMQCSIRHPDKVRKAVIISSTFRSDGAVAGASDAISKLAAEDFKGSTLDTEYEKLSPTPNDFPKFVKRLAAMASKPYDFGEDKLKATKAPMFFIHGDADGVRLDHIAEMFRLKGGETHGDMGPRTASRLAILPDTTHVTLMQRMPIIVPMVNDFLDAKTQTGSPTGGVSLSPEQVLKIARDAVAANDTWVENAELETPERMADGSWSVLVWRLPKTPGGHRLILIDEKGNVTAYLRGR